MQGFFIEVSKGSISKVPDDYIRRQTLRNSERYITAELKDFEEKALGAEEIYRRRKPLYERFADVMVDNDRAVENAVRQILEVLG